MDRQTYRQTWQNYIQNLKHKFPAGLFSVLQGYIAIWTRIAVDSMHCLIKHVSKREKKKEKRGKKKKTARDSFKCASFCIHIYIRYKGTNSEV